MHAPVVHVDFRLRRVIPAPAYGPLHASDPSSAVAVPSASIAEQVRAVRAFDIEIQAELLSAAVARSGESCRAVATAADDLRANARNLVDGIRDLEAAFERYMSEFRRSIER